MNIKISYCLIGLWVLSLIVPKQLHADSAQNSSQEKIKIACVGNSVTKGFGINKAEIYSYPSQLQRLLGGNYEVQNFGHNGATLLYKGHRPYVLTEEYKRACAYDADIVVVHLGLNDTDPRNWPNYKDDFLTDYMSLIDSFRVDGGKVPEVYICRMSPIFREHSRFKSGTRDWFWQIQQEIETVAKNSKVRLIDLHSPLYCYPNLFTDAIHPNKEGAAIVAQTVCENITGDFGGLRLAPIFMDNMVLQRNRDIPVWGKANRGETITLTLDKQMRTTEADDQGNWEVSFDSLATRGSYTLRVSIDKEQNISINNILVGEVWVCAGQSNMAFELKKAYDADAMIAGAAKNDISLLNVCQANGMKWDSLNYEKVNRLEYFDGKWIKSSPNEAALFSAIGYSFGHRLSETLEVPVGLIQISVGGAPIEAFIDRRTMEFDPTMVDVLSDWKHNDFIMKWCRKRVARNLKASTDSMQRHFFEPAYLYDAGVRPIAGFPVAGVIWYQGESNAHNPEHYRNAFPALVKSWRSAFNQPNMPFYFAQLSSISRPSWPCFRNLQRQLVDSISNMAMVVTSDLGDSLDVHPKQKIEVGERFSDMVLSRVYRISNRPNGGPEISSAVQRGEELVLTFLEVDQLATSDNQPVGELEVAGVDGLFRSVSGVLHENKIIIHCGSKDVKRVRYGWKPYSRGNLVDETKLPASTFEKEVQNLNNN